MPRPPRYHDAHTHLSAGAVDLTGVDLRGTEDPRAVASLLGAAARAAPLGAWVRAWGWNGSGVIVDAWPDRPVFVTRRDGHAAWINRLGRRTLDTPGSEPVIREEAFDAARKRLPEPSARERDGAVGPRLERWARAGIASLDDMVEPWGVDLYARLRDRLPLAVGLWLPEDTREDDADAIRRAFPAMGPVVAVRGVKLFLDGTLGARTAALSAPYADDPGNAGALRIPEHEIAERVSRWTRRGWAVAIHALGDRAVSLALDALASAPRSAMGPHRIEHAQVVLRTDLPRFAASGVVASVQPGHWRDDLPWLGARLGDRAGVVVHPLALLARAGATLLFGSDWPVSSWRPEEVLAAAIDPRRGEEALTEAEASAWYTSAPR